MKKIENIFCTLFLILCTVACETINEFPDNHPVDPTLIDVEVSFTFNIGILPYSSSEFLNRSVGSTHDVRYIIDMYPDGNNTMPVRQVLSSAELSEGVAVLNASFRLHAAKYKAVVWIDHVDRESVADKYYTTNDLSLVKIIEPYTGNNDDKDAFSGTMDIDLTSYRKRWNVKIDAPIVMERPFAKLEIITTDISKYLDKLAAAGRRSGSSKFTVKFNYSGYFPCGYNVLTGKPNDSKMGLGFNSVVEIISDEEARLGYDYVFVNGAESGVIVDMIIYDESGGIVNQVGDVAIPIKRGKITTIKGEFLTRDYKPGIGIDPDFDGEITVEIPD